MVFRPRFTLSALMVGVTFAAIVSAVYGMHQRALLAEDRALGKIGNKGGWVLLYTEGAYIEFVAASQSGPLIAGCGTGLERVYRPSGSAASFQDADLVLFEDVRALRSVNFKHTDVSMAAVSEFKRLHPKCHVEF